MDHLITPEIVKQFEWDARKVYRYDGESSTRIFTEPWTGDRFWDLQVNFQMAPFNVYTNKL